MVWIAFALILALVGIFAYHYWRIRRERQTRLISFVALLREPVDLRPDIIGTDRREGLECRSGRRHIGRSRRIRGRGGADKHDRARGSNVPHQQPP